MGLQEDIRTETVDQLNVREAVILSPTTVVRDAVKEMRERNSGCAVVVDKHRKPIGFFTESNLIEMLAHHAEAMGDTIDKHMAQRFPWIRATDPIADLLEAMQLKNIRILCVVDKHDRVLGITGQRGLMEYVAEHFPGQVMVQRVGQPSYLSDREGA